MELDWLKKNQGMSIDDKRMCIDPSHPEVSIQRQCELIGLNRSSWYYQASPAQECPENLNLMHLIDKQYTRTPFYGSRKVTAWLNDQGYPVNRKRIQRLMRLMGIQTVGSKLGTSLRNKEYKVYPYLLNGVDVVRPNQVLSTDITYCPMPQGFMYLVAIIDWYSRYVVSWELSNTLDADFCIDALNSALEQGEPDIINTDQGCQFTSYDFLAPL